MKYLKYIQMALVLLVFFMGHTICAQDNFISDNNVTDRVETEMAWQVDIPADRIDVETNEGIVMLSGTVPNLLAKERAETLAGAIRGVRGVVNQITVKANPISDAELAEKVRRALFKDPAADSYEIQVYAKDGVVRLTGTVESWQEKKLSEYAVMRVKGVQEVKNNLDMEPVHDRPDNEIKAEIEAAIQNDVRLYMSPVIVEVENGEVQLKGSVGSLNDQRLALNYAWTYGVNSVDVAELGIDPWLKSENLRSKKYPIIDDIKIEKAIMDAFMYDPRVMSTRPDVKVSNGVVTLKGVVTSLESKRAAEADARNIVGVTMVKNNLKVRGAIVESDEALTQKVKAALVDHTGIDLFDINVRVFNGNVYLSGTVNTEHERAMAEEATASVIGVVRIINEIDTIYRMNYTPHPYDAVASHYYPNNYTFSPDYNGYPMSDVQIFRNIEQEWWWDSEVEEEDVSVEVSYGVATLSGQVDSWQEMDAVVQNAFEGGAKSIINNIQLRGEDESN